MLIAIEAKIDVGGNIRLIEMIRGKENNTQKFKK